MNANPEILIRTPDLTAPELVAEKSKTRSALTLFGGSELDSQKPLCVDLDGSLIAIDSLGEVLSSVLRTNPLRALSLLPGFVLGRAWLKHRLATETKLDAAKLPYREEVLEFLRAQKAQGRPLILATGAHHFIADAVARHLGIFSDVLASDEKVNLVGKNKARLLEEKFGAKGFHYLGDSRTDFAVWAKADQAIAVGSPQFVARVTKNFSTAKSFTVNASPAKELLKCLRPHHWLKNFILFLPLVLAMKLSDLQLWLQASVSFLAFCAVASSVYLFNDFLDISADRGHPDKRSRPLAAGRVSWKSALIAGAILMASGTALSTTIGLEFAGVVVGYLILNGLYSFWLKRELFLDVILLASFYLIRLFAGGLATSVPISKWLMLFSLFFFLCLALTKRVSELVRASLTGASNAESRRGYIAVDQMTAVSLASSSALLCLLVFCFYVESPTVLTLYKHHQLLFAEVPVLLYLLGRTIFLSCRGSLHSDPLTFILKDRACLLALAMGGMAWLFARGFA